MFEINQLEQENGYLYQQNIDCQNTLQLWTEDHKRVTEENQDLRRQLYEKELHWKGKAEATNCWMKMMEEKQEQTSQIIEADLIMKDEMIARIREGERSPNCDLEVE